MGGGALKKEGGEKVDCSYFPQEGGKVILTESEVSSQDRTK